MYTSQLYNIQMCAHCHLHCTISEVQNCQKYSKVQIVKKNIFSNNIIICVYLYILKKLMVYFMSMQFLF